MYIRQMNKLILILAVSLVPVIAFSSPRETIMTSPYKGVIMLKVQLGQQVKKGQLLFEVNCDIQNVDKEYCEEYVKFSQEIMERAGRIFKVHALSEENYQKCECDLAIAKAQLNIIKSHIATSKFYAPFDGTVTKIFRYDGSGLGDNDPEMEITEGNVKVDTANRVASVCNRWPGVLDVKVHEGQKVKKGQFLFSINTDDIKAQKKMDENKLIYCKKVYERDKKLYKGVHVSLYQYLKAENDMKLAIAAVKKDEIQIQQSSTYAPFDGTVTKIYRYTGSGTGHDKVIMDIAAA